MTVAEFGPFRNADDSTQCGSLEPIAVARGTLPDHDDAPTERPKPSRNSPISCHIAGELLCPELSIALRGGCETATSVPVPEASMHEDHNFHANESDRY